MKTSRPSSRRSDFDSFRHKLIGFNLSVEPTELPDGYKALFVPRGTGAWNHAHLFDRRGTEAAAPLLAFSDEVDFAAWVVDLRKSVASGRKTVKEIWQQRQVIIGEADAERHTRKTATARVHGEIDALVKHHVFTADQGKALKHRLTTQVINGYARDGLTIRDMIENFCDLAG